MTKKNDIFKWLLPLIFSVVITGSIFAYRGGAKIENHEQRLITLENNTQIIKEMDKKIDKLLRK